MGKQQHADIDLIGGARLTGVGRQSLWLPASAFYPISATITMGTRSGRPVWLFAPGATEIIGFDFVPGKGVNPTTLAFEPHWSHPAASIDFGVCWRLAAAAIGNDDAVATAVGTGQTSVDAGGTTGDWYIGPESAAITPSNSWAKGKALSLELARVHDDAGDTLGVDAELIGIVLHVPFNESNDA